jgi:hypothetical protein
MFLWNDVKSVELVCAVRIDEVPFGQEQGMKIFSIRGGE